MQFFQYFVIFYGSCNIFFGIFKLVGLLGDHAPSWTEIIIFTFILIVFLGEVASFQRWLFWRFADEESRPSYFIQNSKLNAQVDRLMRNVDAYVSFEVIVPNPECKICFSQFNEFRLPYLLKECGHTICEICAWKLVQRREQFFVICPFCRKTTTSEGPENILLVNDAIKEFMEENVKEK